MREGKKVLVVDDDPVVGLSCKRILGAEGYDVHAVTTGSEAIKRMASEEIDLLISDIRLPDIYGIDVLGEARRTQPGTDVVMITGYPTLEDAKEAIKLGAFEFLEKPFTPDFMRNIAGRVFNKRGWILRKAFIEQFKQYIVTGPEMDNTIIYYKDGVWARPVAGGQLWELGFDVRNWYLGGHLLYIDMPAAVSVKSGEVFARLLLGEGQVVELKSPMSGAVKEINLKVNETLCGMVGENCLSENWLTWLLRIAPGAA